MLHMQREIDILILADIKNVTRVPNTIAEQILSYYSQIKLTQVSNIFHVYTIFRLTFYKILISPTYLYLIHFGVIKPYGNLKH